MKMPMFTASHALARSVTRPFAGRASRQHDDHMRSSVVTADVPGGPGNVPVGYNRECKQVPYVVCDLLGCRTEYAWVCTFTPIRQAF
jgi:hypothetical protein